MKNKTQIRYDSAYYCPNNFASKFKKLLDVRYSDYKEHKRRSAFENEYLDRFQKDPDVNSISSSTKQWFALAQRPSIEKLMNICELLECDIDYFLTKQEEFEKDVQYAAETIGLGYRETEIISNLPSEQKEILSILIISQNLGTLLKDFADYAHSNLQHGIVIDDSVSEKNEHKKREIDGDELRMIRKYDISNKVSNILEFLRKCYWNDNLKAGVDVLKKRFKDEKNNLVESLRLSGTKEDDIKKISSTIPDYDSALDNLCNELKI